MRKASGLNKDLVSEYEGLLDSLSKEYIDKKIDINTLELKYRRLTDNIAKKYGMDIWAKKTIENQARMRSFIPCSLGAVSSQQSAVSSQLSALRPWSLKAES